MLELDTTGQFTKYEYLKVEESDEGLCIKVYVDACEGVDYDRNLIHFAETTIDREQVKELFEYLKVKLNEKEN